MCDFQVGDEVEYVGIKEIEFYHVATGRLRSGVTYLVESICDTIYSDVFSVKIAGIENINGSMGFDSRVFRRIQRRDLTAWLNQSVGNTDKLDKKKVRVK